MPKKWNQILKKVKGYEKAKTESEDIKGFGNVEDGRYQAQLNSMEIAESQNGRPQLNCFLTITEGEYADETPAAFHGLDEKGLKYTLAMLGRLGYEIPDSLSDIPAVVEALDEEKPNVIIAVKNGFASIEKLDEEETEEVEGAEEGAEEEPAAEEEAPEEEAPEEEAEEPAEEVIGVGTQVAWASKKYGDLEGEIIEVIEEENKVRIKTEDGKIFPVALEKLSLVETEEAEEPAEEEEETVPEKPKKTPKKKTAAKKKVVKKTAKRKK